MDTGIVLLLAFTVCAMFGALAEKHVPERVFDWVYKQVTR